MSKEPRAERSKPTVHSLSTRRPRWMPTSMLAARSSLAEPTILCRRRTPIPGVAGPMPRLSPPRRPAIMGVSSGRLLPGATRRCLRLLLLDLPIQAGYQKASPAPAVSGAFACAGPAATTAPRGRSNWPRRRSMSTPWAAFWGAAPATMVRPSSPTRTTHDAASRRGRRSWRRVGTTGTRARARQRCPSGPAASEAQADRLEPQGNPWGSDGMAPVHTPGAASASCAAFSAGPPASGSTIDSADPVVPWSPPVPDVAESIIQGDERSDARSSAHPRRIWT